MSYVRLEPAAGPECPRCGCTDAEILAAPRSRREVLSGGWFAAARGPRQSSSASKRPPAERPGDEEEGDWFAPGRAQCRHCGLEFWYRARGESREQSTEGPAASGEGEERPPAAVVYHLVACPACGSTDTRVTSTARPVRRHKCRQCGHPFKSVERGGAGR